MICSQHLLVAHMGASRIYSRCTKTTPFQGYGGRIVDCPVRAEAAERWFGRHLPPAAFDMINWSSGCWTAPLPEKIPEEVANDFGRGVLPEAPVHAWVPVDEDEIGPEMAARIAATLECSVADLIHVPKASLVLLPAQWTVEHLRSSPGAVALIREMSPRPSSAVVSWTSALGTLYPVANAGQEVEAVADLMDSAATVDGEMIVLTTTRNLSPLVSQHLLDRDLLELLVGASNVILGAYDGEGYVRWSRGKLPDPAPQPMTGAGG